MKPSLARKAIIGALRADLPVFLWGNFGIGKSDLVRGIADEMNLKMIDIRAAQLDAVDTRGLPSVEDGLTIWNVPDFFPRDPASIGLIFFDELSAAPPLVQSALLQLILDRKLGDYILPAGWRIIAAGNRQKDGAGIGRFNGALANRFAHVTVEVDFSDWVDWAAPNLDPRVVAFIQSFPQHLLDSDPKREVNATPRTWEFVSRVVAVNDGDIETLSALIPGMVGGGIGSEFLAFMTMVDAMTQYEAIIADPLGVAVPEKLDQRYAVINMVAHRAEAKDAKAVFQFIGRLPKDFQAATIQLLSARKSPVVETPHYANFARA